MKLDLPQPIADYFAAEWNPSRRLSECFTADAVVKDDGRTHQGHAEIDAWKDAFTRKYTCTNAPLEIRESGSQQTVVCRVSGNFPGSPLNMTYQFKLAGEKIAFMEIGV